MHNFSGEALQMHVPEFNVSIYADSFSLKFVSDLSVKNKSATV